MSERVGHLRQRPMFNATLLGLFAGLGLLLAAIGVYGLLAFLVAERTQEFGVRMALGGTPGEILPLVLGKGMKLVGAGALAGLLASLAATRLLQSLLFEVASTDTATFAAVALALGAAALLASYIPARRAMRVDPAVALRHE
jgi:ABC-type antimicrobial peptide transport system permease subunit